MANAVATQILEQGERNVVMKLTGLLDTSDESRVIKVDVSALAPPCTLIRVDEIQWQISSQLTVKLDWDATTPVLMTTLVGYEHIDFRSTGGLLNNAGTGITGDIFLTTIGWASGTQSYTIWLHLVKQGVIG